MPPQSQEPVGAIASSQPCSGSTTQIEPRVAAAVAAAAAAAAVITDASREAEDLTESTRPFTRSQGQARPKLDFSVKTAEIEARVAKIAAVLQTERELELERETNSPESLTVEQVTALLTDALHSVPDARLIFASPQYPQDMKNDSSIVRLSHTAGDRVTFGVLQQTHNVDFNMELPFQSRSARIEVAYQIFFDPGTDNCLLTSWTHLPVYVTCLSSSPSTQERIIRQESLVIWPGIWKISLDSNGDDVAEFLLVGRKFTVAIYEATDAPSAKRAANDNDEGHGTKRQKMEVYAKDIVAAPSTQNQAEIELASLNTSASNADAGGHHPTMTSSAREIVNKTAIPFLELADKETAVIKTLKVSSATSRSTSTAKGPATYQLRRIGYTGATRSTSVFSCRHSSVRELVVAKVLRHSGESTHNVAKFARLWKREKEMLENLKHRNIVELKAFDGRMFAIYLEPLPASLFRGIKSTLKRSDAYTILHDISSALAYLISQSIIHNDIKPLNITYSTERGAVLIDFGMATDHEDQITGGSPWYLPPDILYGKQRGFPGDVWALGITMLYILGKIDFPERSVKSWPIGGLSKKGESQEKMLEWLELITRNKATLNQDKIERIVFSMLEWDGELRIKAESITAALESLELDSGNDDQPSDGKKIKQIGK